MTKMDQKPKFKVGDLVRKTNLSRRFGPKGIYQDVVTSVDNGVVQLKESFWHHVEELELVEPSSQDYDVVNKPEHYNHGDGIECIEYIKQVLGPEGFIAYCRGNQIKYQHRAMYKGNPLEDLEKAEQYLKWAIETLKEKTNE